MTVSVRPWAEISADLRRWNMVLTREAADAGDALATEVAATLPDCPTCGGTGYAKWYEWGAKAGTGDPCPAACVDGKVTVAQMAALWDAVHDGFEFRELQWGDEYDAGAQAAIEQVRGAASSVRPVSPSPKGET